jgi:hypothetical protein
MISTGMEKVIVAMIGGFQVMVERCIGCNEDYATLPLPECECRVFRYLQHRPWQEGVATQEDYILGGAP